ncbi:MAG: acyl-CoA thioesterase [Campylobacter sp.]|nr:acyl-CoA thioesterase [Campylobacter sp.]
MISEFYSLKAEFYDVDSMGVVWHGNYVRFLESARCSFLDELGCDYMKMKDSGFALPVIKLDLKFVSYIKFKQIIKVKIDIDEYDVFLRLKYTIFDEDLKTKLCEASTTQVAVTLEGETLYELPQVLKDALQKVVKK